MTVLVAHDGSSFGTELAEMGGVLSAATRWPLRIVHVREPYLRKSDGPSPGDSSEPVGWAPAGRKARATGPEQLTAAAAHVERLEGDPAEAIVEFALREPVTLVGFGLRSQRRAGLGHVAARLLVTLRTPVLVARPGMRTLRSLRRVLVPLDGSPSMSLTPRHVAELLPNAEPEVVGLHIAGRPPLAAAGAMSVPRMLDQWHYDWPAWREEFRRRMAWGHPVDDYPLHVGVGDPGELIAREAERCGADLVVATWNGSLQPGRAACLRRLLESSPCPLLLVDQARVAAAWHRWSARWAEAPGRARAASGPAVHPRVA